MAEGYNIMSALSWQAAGRTAYKLAQRMDAEDDATAAAASAGQRTPVLTEVELRARERRKRDCRAVGDKMVDAMRILVSATSLLSYKECRDPGPGLLAREQR